MSEFNWQKETEIQWNDRAASWHKRSATMWEEGSRKDIIPFIQKHLKKESDILDVGCGDGFGTFQLYQAGYHPTGIDISESMIELAKQHDAENAISFSKGSIQHLLYADGMFDSVMAINVLEWTESPLEAICEVRRVLKKDGLFFVGILGPTAGPRASSYPRLYDKHTICHTIMPWECKQLAEENGFTYVDGFGVYKKGVEEKLIGQLSLQLRQALSFMWVFCLRKVESK